MGIYGSPHHEDERNATFFYEETIYEPRGVHIRYLGSGSKGAERVLAQLKRLVSMGEMEKREILSEARYQEIEGKYRHLKDYFYTYEDYANGRTIRQDKAIFQKYHKILALGGTEAVDKEEIMAQAQELMMSGRIEEGTILIEQINNSMVASMEYACSPEVVDSWIECLEEMDACKFAVIIRIDR